MMQSESFVQTQKPLLASDQHQGMSQSSIPQRNHAWNGRMLAGQSSKGSVKRISDNFRQVESSECNRIDVP